MGVSWLPEPPVGHRSANSLNAVPVPPAFFVDSDNDDHDAVTGNDFTENNGYHLLNDQDYPSDGGIEDNDTEEDSNGPFSPITLSNETSMSNEVLNQTNDDSETSESVNSASRDITVDYDQVRAAMARVTLPPTAIPSWASAVPDSEWCSFLQNRIRSLQEHDNSHSQASSSQDNG